MKSLVEVRGRLGWRANNGSFRIMIESPAKKNDEEDVYCRIYSIDAMPDLDVDVYGGTPQQAIRLALETTAATVIRILLEDVIGRSTDG